MLAEEWTRQSQVEYENVCVNHLFHTRKLIFNSSFLLYRSEIMTVL